MISPQELDRLEQQAKVRLQWIKDVRDGKEVVVESLQDTQQWMDVTPSWDARHTYRLSYPSTPKERVPVRGDTLLFRDDEMEKWYEATFRGFNATGNPVSLSGLIWNHWKFPDEPEQVKEAKTFKEVELGPEDWNGVWWIKGRRWDYSIRDLVLGVTVDGVKALAFQVTYKSLMTEGWLRSRDGVEWERCVRKVEVKV